MRTGVIVGGILLVAGGLLGLSVIGDRPRAVVTLDDVLAFPGATGWSVSECADASCSGEWRHASGLVVQVLVVPVPEPARLPDLAQRLQSDVVADGGRVDTLAQGGGVIRMLRPVDVDGVEHVVISYVLVAPDQRALHVVTTSTRLSEQVPADERVRDLLAFAAWVRPEDGG
jgi:hypothetical protein